MKTHLLALVAARLLVLCSACTEITEYFGTFNSALEIERSTFSSPGTSCRCCAQCHSNSACKSFSFQASTNECILYGKVGGYADFSRDAEGSHDGQFFFMPFSSLTNEFCRTDRDCVNGEPCRGRVCTADTTITCRDLYLLNSGLPDHRYWGYIAGKEQRLYCRMEGDYQGATLLLASNHPATDGVHWTRENILDKTFQKDNYPNEQTDYSILGHADLIRDHLDGDSFHVYIVAEEHGGEPRAHQTYQAPKTMSLLSGDVIPFSSGQFRAWPAIARDDEVMAFPYLLQDAACPSLITTLHIACAGPAEPYRSLAVSGGGAPWWPKYEPRSTVVLYIRE